MQHAAASILVQKAGKTLSSTSAILHTGYNIGPSGVANGLLGTGRKLALVIGDENLDSRHQGLFEQFYLLMPNLKGYWVPGGLNNTVTTPINAVSEVLTNVHLGVQLDQWRRPEQLNVPGVNGGLVYDTAKQIGDGTAGVGNIGNQSGGGLFPTHAHELIFNQSGATAISGQKFCSFSLASYGTSRDDWALEDLTCSIFFHVPAANASGSFPIATGISLAVGAWRGAGSPTITGNLLGSATPNTIVKMTTTLAAGAGAPRIALFNTAATNYQHRGIPTGAMFYTSSGDGLDMICAGSYQCTLLDPDGAGNLIVDPAPVCNTALSVRAPTVLIFMIGQNIDRPFPFVGTPFGVIPGLEDPSQETGEGLWSEIMTDNVHNFRITLGGSPYTGTPVLMCLPVFAGQVDTLEEWDQLHRNLVVQSKNQCDYSTRFNSATPEKWRTGSTAYLDLSALATPSEVMLNQGERQIIQNPGDRFTGLYSNATAYLVGDIAVDPDNESYVTGSHRYFLCKTSHTNQPTTNGTYWEPLDFRWTPYFAAKVVQYIIDEVLYAQNQGSGATKSAQIPGIGLGFD